MTGLGGLRDCATLAILLLSVGVGCCPDDCMCTPLADIGQWVHCSVSEGGPFPLLPPDTVVLDLQGNGLRAVPPGTLDHLARLQRLKLMGNPWECSCRILYLKHWLEDRRGRVTATGTRCSLPDGSYRSIPSLSGNEIPGCRRAQEPHCLADVRVLGAALSLVLLSVGLLAYAAAILRRIRVDGRRTPGALWCAPRRTAV
ncbi:platelet glycoprotein IX-like [Scleropages formosus]|uniref:Platelet glycoprotein IX-like n=1 Tax=Scleropages formosus TaxID=113540 RepID=A0A0P7XNS8_SCLFO|nr:platelet glycoprotein IX-like [Scleropages formosus]KPP76978.1 platelet glycoprotein IX-like [Scleropages formosus]